MQKQLDKKDLKILADIPKTKITKKVDKKIKPLDRKFFK